ncbi:hypothetical protein [Microbacterium sp.]|uniref:hypothetical protein n=1 Tax=Microbacterium sp. TaxID=51671 RepID=UPI003A94D07A
MSNETVRATVYLQVQPEYKQWMTDRSKPESINGAKVIRSTQKRSASPEPGTVEVKLTIELPKAAFTPLAPEAIVVIPETMTQPHPVEVEAADANEEN